MEWLAKWTVREANIKPRINPQGFSKTPSKVKAGKSDNRNELFNFFRNISDEDLMDEDLINT